MAISAVHYRLMCALRGILPVGGDVLQIGEANWYGDMDPNVLLGLSADDEVRAVVRLAIESGDRFAIAKALPTAVTRAT